MTSAFEHFGSLGHCSAALCNLFITMHVYILMCLFAASVVLRLLIMIRASRRSMCCKQARTMVVLGSGGHTAEMLMLVDQMDKTYYTPRIYVVAATDKLSGRRALDRAAAQGAAAGSASVLTIPRSREVGQSYLTSVGTTLYSLLFAFMTVVKHKPQLVLANGPGTCIPICAAAYAMRFLGLSNSRVVYVESIARVKKLSLSGKILYLMRMADLLFVQWPALQQKLPRSVHAGRLY